MLGRGLDLEGLARGEPDLPGHLAGGAVQVVLVAVQRLRQLHQHALGQAAVQVQEHGVAPHGAHMHATAPDHQVMALEAGDGVDLVGQKALDAGGAGQKQVQLVHSWAPSIRAGAYPVPAQDKRCSTNRRRPRGMMAAKEKCK